MGESESELARPTNIFGGGSVTSFEENKTVDSVSEGGKSQMTYLDLARKKVMLLDDALATARKYDWYNEVVVAAQQVAEFGLKSVLEKIGIDSKYPELMSSHVLYNLAKSINQELGHYFKLEECRILEEYYFNGRYPGHDFIDVSESDAVDAVTFAKSIHESVEDIWRGGL